MRLIDADTLRKKAKPHYFGSHYAVPVKDIDEAPAVDAVPADVFAEKIITKKAEVSDYWMNDVKQYRATQGYSDIEHDVDNFLRGYNEAVEDMLAILDSERKDGVNGDS